MLTVSGVISDVGDAEKLSERGCMGAGEGRSRRPRMKYIAAALVDESRDLHAFALEIRPRL